MKEQILRLETHDDVVSVRDKLAWLRAQRVLLVLPDDPRQPILQRRLDLVLIQREATRRQAEVALITRDPIVVENARELGIACFPSIKASSKHRWRTARAKLDVERAEQPVPLTPELAEAAADTRTTPANAGRIGRSGATALFSATVTLVLVLTFFVGPGATVRLDPATNQVAVTTRVIAAPNVQTIDEENNRIPARSVGVELEGSATVNTTGTAAQPTDYARGIALFSNQLPEQVTIPAGTIVRTSAAQPVRFRTLDDVTLPGGVGETVEVAIEALEPGFTGNLPSARINQVEGPLASRLAVTNSAPTQGGDVTDVPAISEDDRERVRALLLQELTQRAYAEMQLDPLVNLQDTEFIPLDTLGVVLEFTEIYDGAIDQPGETLTLTMRVVIQGVAIDERMARQVVYGNLADRVNEGFRIDADTLVFRRGEITGIEEDGSVTFVMQAAGDVTAVINEEEVRWMLLGSPMRQAQLRLNRELPLQSPAEIEAWPSFWPLMPAFPLRIQVETT